MANFASKPIARARRASSSTWRRSRSCSVGVSMRSRTSAAAAATTSLARTASSTLRRAASGSCPRPPGGSPRSAAMSSAPNATARTFGCAERMASTSRSPAADSIITTTAASRPRCARRSAACTTSSGSCTLGSSSAARPGPSAATSSSNEGSEAAWVRTTMGATNVPGFAASASATRAREASSASRATASSRSSTMTSGCARPVASCAPRAGASASSPLRSFAMKRSAAPGTKSQARSVPAGKGDPVLV